MTELAEPLKTNITRTVSTILVNKAHSERVGLSRYGAKMINKINVIGNLDYPGYECINRVYDINGICPTITNMQGGGRQPKIMIEVKAIDEQNQRIREETFGTLTTDGSSPKHNNRVMIKQATKQGYIPCEVGGWQI